MRSFFITTLSNLKISHGLLQWERLKESGETETNALLDALCEACNQDPYILIPEIVKQRVIKQYMLRDADFIGLNVAVITRYLAKFFSEHGDKFMPGNNPTHVDNSKLAPLSEETVAIIEEFKAKLKSQQPRFEGIGEDIKKIKAQDKVRTEGRTAVSANYANREADIIAHENHNLWIRYNYDTYTGKPLPSWLPEEEWIKQNTPAE